MIRVAAMLSLLISCAASEDRSFDLDPSKSDSAFLVSLSAAKTVSQPRGVCQNENGCRVRLVTLPRSSQFLQELPDGAHHVATLRVMAGADLLLDTKIQLLRDQGSVNFSGWEHDFVLPEGPFILEFTKEPLIPELGIDLDFSSVSVASQATREECHTTCGQYVLGECLTSGLAEACHEGCNVASSPEVAEFTSCGFDGASTCDTFCFVAIPGVIRFTDGCRADFDDCPMGYACHQDVCIPES